MILPITRLPFSISLSSDLGRCGIATQNELHIASKFVTGRDATNNPVFRKVICSPPPKTADKQSSFPRQNVMKFKSPLYMSYAVITPIKLLRLALLGYKSNWVHLSLSLDQTYGLRQKYVANKNTTNFRSLIHRFNSSLSLDCLQPDDICAEMAKEYLEYQRPLKISQLKCIISLLSSTRKGCLALSQLENDKILLDSINRSEVNSMNWTLNQNQRNLRHFIKSRRNDRYLTSQCNNLGLNMISRGVIPGSQLSGKNIKTATSRFQLRTIQNYLAIFHNPKITISSSLRQALSALAHNIRNHRNTKNFVGISESERTEIIRRGLQMLTGWKNDGVPSPGEERSSSFATIPCETVYARDFWLRSYYPTYLCALGDLGLIQALKAEWESFQENSRSIYLTCLFAAVFLLAKEPHTALLVIESARHLPTPSFEDEDQCPTSPTLARNESQLDNIILAMYTYYRIKTTVNFRKRLKKIKFFGPTYETLVALIPYIPPTQVLEEDALTMDDRNNYLVGIPRKKNSVKDDYYIDWTRDCDENMGLLISDQAGIRPLYWRTESMSKKQLWTAITATKS